MPDSEGLPTEAELYVHAIKTIADLRAEAERLQEKVADDSNWRDRVTTALCQDAEISAGRARELIVGLRKAAEAAGEES